MQHRNFEYARALSDLDQNQSLISGFQQRIAELEAELRAANNDIKVLKEKLQIYHDTKHNPDAGTPPGYPQGRCRLLLAKQKKNFVRAYR